MSYNTEMDPCSPNFRLSSWELGSYDDGRYGADLFDYDLEMAAQRILVRWYPERSH